MTDGNTPKFKALPRKSKSSKTPLIVAAVGCGCLVFLIVAAAVGVYAYQLQSERAENTAQVLEAKRLTDQAWEKLALYKTNRSANSGQPNLIVEANDLARRANTIAPSEEATALKALTQVWSNRWHLMSSDDFRMSAWEEDDRLTAALVTTNSEPAAYLARAWVLAYGCHLQGNPNPENKTCSAAATAISSAKGQMGGAPGWLRFEMVWSEADYWNRHGHYSQRKKNHSAAKRAWRKVLQVCESPIEPMSSAPVNDEELMEPCMTAAGAVGDYDKWLSWAHAMRRDDIKDHRRTRSTTMKSIFRTAVPDCLSPRLKLRRVRGYKNYPRVDVRKNPAHPLCAAAGMIAMDCRRHADSFTHLRYSAPEYNSNWDQLFAAARRTPVLTADCYLDKQ